MRQTTVLLMLVLCSTLVLAQSQETALRATVSYNADGSATLNEMSVTLAGIDQQTDRPLPDGVQLVLDNSVVYALPAPVSFRLLDAFVPLSSYTRTFRLPYFGNRGVLRVIRNNQSVLEFDLNKLCDNNGICGAYENGISCPADCDISHKDIVCLPYEDGICDPDCAERLDPDCAEGTTTRPTTPPQVQPGTPQTPPATQPGTTPPATPTQPEAPLTMPAPADLPLYFFLVIIVTIIVLYLWSKKTR